MPTLSVIIITKNEAENIRQCLESVKWADEIVVFDSDSTDGTPDICRKYTDKVFETDWPGFGPQKNRALAQATGEWVLSIDADETINQDLREEISTVINAKTPYSAYAIPRISKYCGRTIRYGDWRSDKPVRLFLRNKAQFKDVLVHEKLIVDGKIHCLKSPLHHDTFKDLSDVLNKVNRYSSLTAQMRLRQGKKAGMLTAICHGAWTFIRGYLLRLGFLDGKEGFILAASNAEGTYYRYLKLMYLQNRIED